MWFVVYLWVGLWVALRTPTTAEGKEWVESAGREMGILSLAGCFILLVLLWPLLIATTLQHIIEGKRND